MFLLQKVKLDEVRVTLRGCLQRKPGWSVLLGGKRQVPSPERQDTLTVSDGGDAEVTAPPGVWPRGLVVNT